MFARPVCRKILTFLFLCVLVCGIQVVLASGAVVVKTGDWIKYEYVFSEDIPPGTPFPEWMKVEFLSVEGSTATVRLTLHLSDGTEQSQTVTGDLGGQELSGLLIPVNSTAGDSVYIGGYGYVILAGEITRTYAGVQRTVVYATFSVYGTEVTYYWDKLTGITVEASVSMSGVSGVLKAVETNMLGVTQNASVNVVPASATIGISSELVLNVTVSDVPTPGLYAYEFKLRFDPAILEAVSAEIPSDHMLKPSLKASNIFIVDSGTINQTEGFVHFAVTLLADEPGKTGSGVLCTATLRGKAEGTSSVTLENVVLIDGNGAEFPSGSFTFNNGMVTVQSGGAWDYSFSDSSGKGTLLNIDTADGLFQFITPDKDYGTRKATDMQIGTTIVTNDGFKVGSKDVVVWIMHEDRELRLTALAFPKQDLCWVKAIDLRTDKVYKLIRWPWRQDVNKDGKVNIQDIAIVAKNFGSKPGDPSWNQDADIDENGQINMVDISKVAKDFGKTA